MGKITVFTEDCSLQCKHVKDLLAAKQAPYEDISITLTPAWKPFLFILTRGNACTPQVFFNDVLIGGASELQSLEDKGELETMLKACLEGPVVEFPPPLREPTGQEFMNVIPEELRQKWQRGIEAMDSRLGGTPEKPISSMLVVMESPEQMIAICSAGPAAAVFLPGATLPKGTLEDQNKVYCQMAVEQKKTLFIQDPLKIPGLQKNVDWVEFGYGQYIGAPWIVGETKGTVLAMEKEVGILRQEHVPILEAQRDVVQRDLAEWRASH